MQCWCGALIEYEDEKHKHFFESPEDAQADLESYKAIRKAIIADTDAKAAWRRSPAGIETDRQQRAAVNAKFEAQRKAKAVIDEINRSRVAIGKILGLIPENFEPYYGSCRATAIGMYDEIPDDAVQK